VPAPVPPAVISFAFDPLLRLGQTAVRWETLGLATAVFVALVAAALIARETPREGGGGRLRRDDLLFAALGATPGAVIAGRLGYVLVHFDYYAANPGEITNPSSGGLELSLAIVGGVLTGYAVGTLLDGTGRRWAYAATIPIVAALALGKIALALGGAGQGEPGDLPWATLYLGPGPWGSLAPAVPSHPAQLYEALGYVVALMALAIGLSTELFVGRDGRLFGVALAMVGCVRFLVAFSWRDAGIIGPIRVEHVLALAPLTTGVVAWLLLRRERGVERPVVPVDVASWPDPSVAERWRTGPGRR